MRKLHRKNEAWERPAKAYPDGEDVSALTSIKTRHIHMHRHSVSRTAGLSALACALVAPVISSSVLRADEVTDVAAPHRLEAYVVSAGRTPQDPDAVPNSVTLFDLDSLANAQISDFGQVLAQSPGVMLHSYGAVGSGTWLSIRGANPSQTMYVVDGVRMSSRQSQSYMNIVMSNLTTAGLDRMELLRGPQGTLYGSSAMGGVLLFNTTHGCGPTKGIIAAELGSFGTWNLGTAVSGGTNTFGYSGSLGWERTDNWTNHNENRSTNFSTRLEQKVTDKVVAGVTLRGQESRYNSPGSRTYPDKAFIDSSNYLSTAYVGYSADSLTSRVTYGWHQVSYDYYASYGLSRYLNTRNVLDWQTSYTPFSSVVLVGGVDGEWAHFKNVSLNRPLVQNSQGVYLTSNYSPLKGLNIQVGGRFDDFHAFGDKATGRAGVSYLLKKTGTKFRTTLGSAFSVPSMTERFGDSQWYVPNSNLKPEDSLGWDFGVDQQLLGGRVVVESTFFKNTYRDMISASYQADSGKYKYGNISRAYSEGFENAVQVRLTKELRLRLSYTYTDVVDETLNKRVVYKPRHDGSADLQWTPTKALTAGVGADFVADRLQTSSAYATKRIEDYTTVRLYASYALAKDLVVKGRIENVLDERYDDRYGYEAMPCAVFGGLEYRF